MRRLAPNDPGIYYENVDVGHLEAALDKLNALVRIIASGTGRRETIIIISSWSSPAKLDLQLASTMVKKSVSEI